MSSRCPYPLLFKAKESMRKVDGKVEGEGQRVTVGGLT